MKKRNLLKAILLLTSAPAMPAMAQNVLDIKNSITDNAIIFPATFEADTQKLLEGWYVKNYTSTDEGYMAPDPGASEETIIRRLGQLPTIIDMPYNQVVGSYIDRYVKKSRPQVAAILALSNYYLPIFEQALEEKGLPLELKYLPVVESGLDPNAVSKHGATGLWQFMLGTAKGLGLEVNSLVDERRDPYVSSEKAAGYLKDLYSAYGDWSLAIAAYNCGPGAVNKAIRRAGGDPKTHSFWSIYNYLTPETRGYVPMFIAANYVMNYHNEHGINPVLPTKPLVTDTVAVTQRIHFDQISNVLQIPVEELRILNPQFRADIIPGSTEHPYFLILPSQQVHAYILSEGDIIAYEAEKYARQLTVEPGEIPSDNLLAELSEDVTDSGEDDVALVRQTAAEAQSSETQPTQGTSSTAVKTVMHKVAAGETLNSIASKYNVEVAQIKQWNSLRRNAVRTGQQLRINVPDDAQPARATASTSRKSETPAQTAAEPVAKGKKAKQNNSTTTKKKEAAPKSTTHTIKSGENLSTIAKKYGVSVDELKKANGMTNDNIRAGKTLTVPGKSKSKSGGSSSGKSSSKKKGKRRR